MSDELNQPISEETVTVAEGGDAGEPTDAVSAAEPQDTDLSENSADDAGENGEASEGDESATSDFIESQAAKLSAADPERFQSLTDRFAADEAFTPEDITWISQTIGLDEATVSYGISLQRVAFQAEQAAAKPDTSLSDAEAELGMSVTDLISFAQKNASPEQYAEWVALQRIANRTGETNRDEGNNLTRILLREMKTFKDSIPGQKPKTLGHLAGNTSTQEAPTPAPTPAPAEPQRDELLERLQTLSDMALARIVQNRSADAAARGRARYVLQQRGWLDGGQ